MRSCAWTYRTGATQYPVAIADFAGDATRGHALAEVIRADLNRTGQFRLIDGSNAGLTVDSSVNYDDWRGKGADFLAYGSINQTPDGRYDIRYRLADTVKRGQLDGVASRDRTGTARASPTRSPIASTKRSPVCAGCSRPGSPMS